MDINSLNQIFSEENLTPENVHENENIRFKMFKENYSFFLIVSLAYAVIFTFSLYHNASGIVTFLYPVSSIVYIILCAQKLQIKFRRSAWFTCTAIVVLAINLFITKDWLLIFLDHCLIFVLTVQLALHMFCDDTDWGMSKYLDHIWKINFIAFEYIFALFTDGKIFRKKNGKEIKNPDILNVIRGLVIVTPILTFVLMLLSSADYFFGRFLNAIFMPLLEESMELDFTLLILFFGSLLCSYAFIKELAGGVFQKEESPVNKSSAIQAITVNSVLGFVYLIFSGFQIITLFIGSGQLPEGYSYAEYAREGFFQLVIVCLINMVWVLACLAYYEKSKGVKGSLLIICACTYLMIVSSAYRMWMYVEVYQLTYNRVFVFWALLVIFMVMNGIVYYIFNEQFKLFYYCVVVGTVLYIIFAYMKPERMIAKNNLSERFYSSDSCVSVDYSYLKYLSSDATPAIAEVYINRRAYSMNREDIYELEGILEYRKGKNMFYGENFDVRKFNFSELEEMGALKKAFR